MEKLCKHLYTRVGIAIALTAMIVCATLFPFVGCSGGAKEISLGQAQWNYDIINSQILLFALEDKGYEVDVKDIMDVGIMFAAIEEGNIDIYPNAWLPDTHSSYVENAKNIVTGGDLWGGECPYVWTVPTFVTEKYDIRSVDDLKGKGDIFDGKITGLEEGSGGTVISREAIVAYDLGDEFEYVASSVAAMIAELDASVKIEKPIIVMLWRPHPIFNRLDLTMLEDPLGVFGLDTVQWAMNRDFYEANPEIVTFMNNFLVPREDMEAMMARNEEGDEAEVDLAMEWYQQHKTEADSWWK